jgi:enoyl-CoA hydratase/carnithine racemase
MGELLIKEVDKWEEQGTKIAIFKGIGGKAFCAGGDVKS